jgi:hypothetical protein
MVPLGRIPEIVQHEAGLDPRLSSTRVEVDDAMKILRPIDDDRRIATLTA